MKVIKELSNSIIPITPLGVVFTRLVLISSAIEFYFGFFLPEPIKKLVLNQNDI